MFDWLRRDRGRAAARATRERFPALFAPDALDGDLVALDTETTGLDPKRAEIVAIGAVRIRGNRLLTSQGLSIVVKPTRPIDPASIRVHQIRPVDVQRGENWAHGCMAMTLFNTIVTPNFYDDEWTNCSAIGSTARSAITSPSQ